MKNIFSSIKSNFCWLLIPAIASWLFSCHKPPEPASILQPQSRTASKASLVSVLATGNQTAEVIVKASPALNPTDWQLTGQAEDGRAIPLELSGNTPLTTFTLTVFRAAGLAVGQTYRFRLRFLYNGRDTINVERVYKHTASTNWHRLAHLAADEGDFTGSVLPITFERSVIDSAELQLSVVRYVTNEQGESWVYDRKSDKWLAARSPGGVPHSYVRFRLQAAKGVYYTFSGLGYVQNQLRPAERTYNREMYVVGDANPVRPMYGGKDGEIAFFTTPDRAFLLTQEVSPELWVRRGNYEQYRGPDLPEPPGTLATFVLNEIGYVVNQIDDQPPHLYAYKPDSDQWVRRADFPGQTRSGGVGFSVGGKGYFGGGITGDNERGLRDIWQYDPAIDKWQYITEYPGQGNRYLIAYSTTTNAYIGWGYESQALPSGGAWIVGCTDFWEFKP